MRVVHIIARVLFITFDYWPHSTTGHMLASTTFDGQSVTHEGHSSTPPLPRYTPSTYDTIVLLSITRHRHGAPIDVSYVPFHALVTKATERKFGGALRGCQPSGAANAGVSNAVWCDSYTASQSPSADGRYDGHLVPLLQREHLRAEPRSFATRASFGCYGTTTCLGN